MYNNNNSTRCSHSEHHGAPTMSPRISFSTDFVDSSSSHDRDSSRASPGSTDFEFSLTSRSSSFQMSADELFCKGKILPRPLPRPAAAAAASQSGDGNGVSIKAPFSFKGRWKGLLGLRKTHVGSKNPDSNSHKLGMVREQGGSSAADLDMKP